MENRINASPRKMMFVDCKTTGLNNQACAVYQMSGIFIEDDRETERFDFRIRPFKGARIVETSLWIGGVTRGDLVDYPSEEDAFEAFRTMLERHVNIRNARDKMYIAGFNVSTFDGQFIWAMFRRNKNERFRDYFYSQYLDVMTIAAFALSGERRNLTDFHQSTVGRYLGIDVTDVDNHNTLYEAELSKHIYYALAARLGTTDARLPEPLDKITTNYQ